MKLPVRMNLLWQKLNMINVQRLDNQAANAPWSVYGWRLDA